MALLREDLEFLKPVLHSTSDLRSAEVYNRVLRLLHYT